MSTTENKPRVTELTIADEEFVVYDRENHQAWLQADNAVDVEEMQ